MNTSTVRLVSTLERLGDVTSRNLEFSYRPDVPVSYGEETITESNLLELRHCHSDVIQLRTFSKLRESKVGSDWEWYIVGQQRTLSMRVQAKRVQRNGVLRITHVVARSGKQQRDLLIQAAQADRMRPMYCIYCTEPQRSLWRQRGRPQTGCLLADAGNVPLRTRSLLSIEWACWPWHYLFDAPPPTRITHSLEPKATDVNIERQSTPLPLDWDGPTILDLNENAEREYNRAGVADTTPLDLARVNPDGIGEDQLAAVENEKLLLDKEVRGMVTVDVRSLNP